MEHETDYLIIGSGVAGLSLALKLARVGRVTLITKKGLTDTATTYAQGGIACAIGADDSPDLHMQDTLRAGDGICHEDIVRLVVTQGPDRIRELESLGLTFTRSPDASTHLDLGREGGHSRRRVLHVEDFTGQSLEKTLVSRVSDSPAITIQEYHVAVDLITRCAVRSPRPSPYSERCLGAYVLDSRTGIIHTYLAKATILATGGTGKVYLYTSNPDVATGDGIAMAYRAGARIANLEFVQFHPTCLFHPLAKNFLISEALRGEGAHLIDHEGRRFMEKYAPTEMELANRDVIARAIDNELKKSGKDCVYLDISHRPSDFIRTRFPNIYETCLRFGYDITKEPIPVVPAAHYMCGGVVTDEYGETNIAGLFALGETACTGLHGANRLASNSLLEGLVMAHQVSERLTKDPAFLAPWTPPPVPPWDPGGAVDLDEAVIISFNWDVIRRLMWNYVGIVRSDKRLALARERIVPILDELQRHYWDYILTSDFIEVRNLALVAKLIIECASGRAESRGGHFNADHPRKDDWNWRRDTVITREAPRP
ncbi:MAG: L-aspartate oxidase [Deltaproteobacteria bacterium]